jgi:hypothetical protein
MVAAIPNRSGSVSNFAKREIPYIKILFVGFLLTLPIVNPTVHGDGVGYYAYARALLIQRDLRFEEDWRHANKFFSASRIQVDEQLRPEGYTPTGYVDNHFTVGPAILWAPFLILVHLAVLLLNAVGGHIPADGFSPPYVVAMALGTAFYGFLGLLLSFLLARKYVRDRWAFLATIGIWLATSLPVYMYFNPAWSHAHSAFTVALFLWYWERTRGSRTIRQWVALGLISGLMIDVYFPNGVFLLLPLIESLLAHRSSWNFDGWNSQSKLLFAEALFAASLVLAVLPTFITRWIVYGGLFNFGAYTALDWIWSAPHSWQLLFSSDHGALTWTPILVLALIGLFTAPRNARIIALYLVVGTAAFYYVIACYPFWDGMASFGNRFLISLTAVFVFGLALLFERFGRYFHDGTRAFVAVGGLVILLSMWNAGFIYQWGEHLLPVRGEISFREMIHNQFFVVPRELGAHVRSYLLNRKDEMQKIEDRDIQQMRNSTSR